MQDELGGVNSTNFMQWSWAADDYIRNQATGGRKVLLVYNEYSANISLTGFVILERNNVTTYVLPAHKSGKTQPMDVVVFSAANLYYDP